MSDYENLPFHRKYRPNTLIKYIGNSKIKETAMSQLKGDKWPQTILLSGPSGCGKTTFARLLAKEYSCLNRDKEKGACGVCQNCQIIDDYIATGDVSVLTDIHEIDITEQSRKHDLDEMLEDMQIPPYGDEWKVYILDECHMATSALQNRLLKIAEEPPEHVLMCLCTTNPESMLETLKNRCQLELKVTKPTVKELAGLLKTVCISEHADYDKQGLEFIANRGELTIRTALTNLQQVITEQGDAKYESAISVFGEISNTVMIDIFKALKNKDTLRYVTLLCDIKSRFELKQFLDDLKLFVVRGIYVINNIRQDGVAEGELKAYRELFGDLSIVQIGNFLNRLLSFNMNNLELELLLLGYTGFDTEVKPQKSNIVEIPDEAKKEQQITDSVLKEKSDKEYEEGVKNAEKEFDAVSLDMILSMGGSIVNT